MLSATTSELRIRVDEQVSHRFDLSRPARSFPELLHATRRLLTSLALSGGVDAAIQERRSGHGEQDVRRLQPLDSRGAGQLRAVPHGYDPDDATLHTIEKTVR